MHLIYKNISISLLLLTTACSTMLEGKTQRIAIDSVPQGASCVVKNNGDVIGAVPHTPGAVTIEKSKNDILIECEKIGYGKGRKQNHSDTAITSLGNMVFMQMSFVGNMIDSASGAGHKYEPTVFVELEKDPVLAALPTQPPAFTPPAFQQAVPVTPVEVTSLSLPVPVTQTALTPSQQLGQSLMSQQATFVSKTPQETAAMLLGQSSPAAFAPAAQVAQLSPPMSTQQMMHRPPFDATQ